MGCARNPLAPYHTTGGAGGLLFDGTKWKGAVRPILSTLFMAIATVRALFMVFTETELARGRKRATRLRQVAPNFVTRAVRARAGNVHASAFVLEMVASLLIWLVGSGS